MEKKKYIVFHIDGGMGKGILATAVVEAVKKKYPDYHIIVVTAWDAPWFHNPHIHRVVAFNEIQWFYKRYISPDTIVMRFDPYHSEDYIMQRKHLIKTWCDIYDIPYNGEKPKIYLTPREMELVTDKLNQKNDNVRNFGKPLMVIQSHGGAGNQESNKSWARDLPMKTAQNVVNAFANDYRILHIRREDQPQLDNTEWVSLPHRELYAIIQLSQKRLFIDSFCQHAASALQLPSTVCWVVNRPQIFGYKLHNNILPVAEVYSEFNKFSYLEKYDITGKVVEYPYKTLDIFDDNQIIESIKKQ